MEKDQKEGASLISLASLLKIYELNQNWIPIADTKGGLTLSVNGVLLGFMIAKISQVKNLLSVGADWMAIIVLCTLGVYVVFQLLSCFFALAVVIPRRIKKEKTEIPQVFTYSIIQQFPKLEDTDRFIKAFEHLSEEDLRKDILSQMHIDAVVCGRKYDNSRRSIKTLVIAAIFAIITFVMLSLSLPH